MTPATLIGLLRRCGYEVTERCLTDWRWKGYLPSLARRSRGFRGGVLRYWEETDILQQALDLCRRLKGAVCKRTYGAVHKNWLAGANVSTPRARISWLTEFKRTARFSKNFTQRCATQIGADTALKPGMVRDTLEEFQKICFEPNYPVGKTLDVLFISTVARRSFKTFPSEATAAMGGEKLFRFLSALNATFSPAGFRSAIASATGGELLQARDSYLNFWQNMPSLMPLARALAPLIVPLLLPTKAFEGSLAREEAF